MKAVEFWRWVTIDSMGRRRPSTYYMREDVALARDPDATKVPGSCEIRNVPDSEEDRVRRASWQEKRD